MEIKKLGEIKTIGTATLLSTSQIKNSQIISKHWVEFNKSIRTVKRDKGPSWVKYGITMKRGDRYYYMPAIPSSENPEFEQVVIPGGSYAVFEHRGDMSLLKETVYSIYKEIIPQKGLRIDRERELIHFEQYDKRFHWNREDSIIEIYLPLIGENDEGK